MNKELTLVILAAGMGSRYGGPKQIDEFGPNGEAILEYSIYDAIQAGFNKLVVILSKELEQIFHEKFDHTFMQKIKTDIIFQSLDTSPYGFATPSDRKKPRGTGHAVLSCKDHISGPFAVINADDYYGSHSMKLMADSLFDIKENESLMIGYELGQTLSDHGTVNRGICKIDPNGNLLSIREHLKIGKQDYGIFDTDGNELNMGDIVSMNFFGFHPSIFAHAERLFKQFLQNNINTQNEFYIPIIVDDLIQNQNCSCKVIPTQGEWFGVTHIDDKPIVQTHFLKLIESGIYPSHLWA